MAACIDANAAEAHEESCYKAVIWAKDEGYETHKDWYDKFGIGKDSTFADFQCALYEMKGDGKVNGESHNCSRPCDSTLAACQAPTVENDIVPVKDPEQEASSSLPTFGIVLIVLGVVLLIVSVLFLMGVIGAEKKKPKKKRAIKRAPEPVAEPEPAPAAPVVMVPQMLTTAAPVYMQQPGASFVYSAPMAPMAQPVTTAYATQMPVASMVTPTAYYTSA